MEITNCSRTDIRIRVLDNKTGEAVPGRRTAGVVSAGARHVFDLASGHYLAEISSARNGRGKLIYLQRGLSASGQYTFHRSGVYSHFKSGDDCAAPYTTPAYEPPRDRLAEEMPGGTPYASIMVPSGIWVSGKKSSFRVTGFDGRTFRLRLSAGSRKALGLAPRTSNAAWSTYRLVAKDTYEDDAGNNLAMTDDLQAIWNGVRHRYSWLE